MVRALALRYGDPGFKTRSAHLLNWILVVPGSSHSQMVSLRHGWFVIVSLFCRFVDCVSLALKSPYGEWSIRYVCVNVFYLRVHLENNSFYFACGEKVGFVMTSGHHVIFVS